MTLRRYANKRDKTEPAIFAALRKCGALVYPTDQPTDAICLFRGQVHLIECKTRTGTFTEAQAEFINKWPVQILRSADDAVAFLNSLARRAA